MHSTRLRSFVVAAVTATVLFAVPATASADITAFLGLGTKPATRAARGLSFGVTLLVVDQRPSGIDDEVLSQIGTRISAQLNDEADIAAVLTGMSGATGLKGILAQLDSKQQALVMGHSVPMPVMIETRTYDETMWKTFGYGAVVARDDF